MNPEWLIWIGTALVVLAGLIFWQLIAIGTALSLILVELRWVKKASFGAEEALVEMKATLDRRP